MPNSVVSWRSINGQDSRQPVLLAVARNAAGLHLQRAEVIHPTALSQPCLVGRSQQSPDVSQTLVGAM